MLLPGPGSSFDRQSRHIVKLRQFEQRSAPKRRVVSQRLREIPSGSGQNHEMVMTHFPIPRLGGVGGQELEQIEALLGAGVVIWAVQVAEGVDAGIVREVDGVGGLGICGEAWVFEHPTVENELQH